MSISEANLLAANNNIKLYPLAKVFTKRVFVPLMTIYFVEVAGFNLAEIGLLASVYALAGILAEVPTGYFADVFKRVTSIRMGAFLLTLSTLLLVFFPNKYGIFSGQFIEAVGYSFVSGAIEALAHDSLIVKGSVDKYTKVLSRAQSTALVVNAFLVALIPMTYAFDKRMPFIIGAIFFATYFVFTFFLKDVDAGVDIKCSLKERFDFGKVLNNKRLVIWGVVFGVFGAFATAPGDFLSITIKQLGFNPAYMGWIFAVSSILGAILGQFFHKLKDLGVRKFVTVDSLLIVLPMLSVFTRSIPLIVCSMAVNLGFWRYRMIIYQDFVLAKYKPKYKATMISSLNNLQQLNQLWAPLAIALSVSSVGLISGLALVGVLVFLAIPFYVGQSQKALA